MGIKKISLVFSVIVLVLLSGCNRDLEAPVILGLENLRQTFVLGSKEPDWLMGITAHDNRDGDLTDKIIVDTNVDMEKEGRYHVGYMVKDNQGNQSYKFIDVEVVDISGPIITGFSNLKINVNSPDKPNWFNNLIVTDALDGDLSDKIYVDDHEVNYSLPGDYYVYYNVSDSLGNSLIVPVKLSVLEVGTRINPVKLGEKFIIGNQIEFVVNYVKRGEEAESVVLSPGNNEIDQIDKEYLITNVSIKLLKENKQNSLISRNDFKLIPSLGRIYDTSSSAIITNDIKDCHITYNTVCSGNIVSHVNKHDQFILKFNHTWFNLTNGELPIVPPEQIMGYSLDVVTSSYADYKKIKFSNPIIDEDWLNTINLSKWNASSSTHNIQNGTEYINVYANKRYDSLIYSNSDFYIVKEINNFPQWVKQESGDYLSNFYYVLNSEFMKSRYHYSDNIYLFNQNLDIKFMESLEALSNNNLSFESFFNTYGTHLIVDGFFGAEREIRCAVLSNQYLKSNNSLCSNFAGKTFIDDSGLNQQSSNFNSKVYFSLMTNGGEKFIFNGVDELRDDTLWIKSFEDGENITLLDFGSRGLLPIWEILPEEYTSLQNDMIEEFIKYYQKYKT